jgi:hypothetical protein
MQSNLQPEGPPGIVLGDDDNDTYVEYETNKSGERLGHGGDRFKSLPAQRIHQTHPSDKLVPIPARSPLSPSRGRLPLPGAAVNRPNNYRTKPTVPRPPTGLIG